MSYEICALLRTKKARKPRAPRGPSIKVGASVTVWGRDGVVVGKHETHANWWNVNVQGREVVGFDRSQIVVNA